MATVDLPASTEQALSRPSTLQRWLEFAGGSEFLALADEPKGGRSVELTLRPATGWVVSGGSAHVGRRAETARQQRCAHAKWLKVGHTYKFFWNQLTTDFSRLIFF